MDYNHQKGGGAMKDKLITKIQTSMAKTLDLAQLEELRRVLTNAFHGVEIIENKALELSKAVLKNR